MKVILAMIILLIMYGVAGNVDYNYNYDSAVDCSSAIECNEKYLP